MTVAAIPYTYIEEEKIRLGVYRKVAEAASESDISSLRAELADRFGPPDPAVGRLLEVALLRIIAGEKGISEIETRGDRLMLMKGRDYVKDGRLFPRIRGNDADRKLKEVIAAVRRLNC
jgi:transcription-repair coupling factor (superfamily II helicase)